MNNNILSHEDEYIIYSHFLEMSSQIDHANSFSNQYFNATNSLLFSFASNGSDACDEYDGIAL